MPVFIDHDAPRDWESAPDPLIHSWRWLQPKARFYVSVYEETNALVADFRADLERQLWKAS
jgi:hypothetical protein